jgi:hypothetical protein
MQYSQHTLMQIRYACGRVLRYTPEQLPNLLHAWQRAQNGADAYTPFNLAFDEAIPNMGKGDKKIASKVALFLYEHSPRYDAETNPSGKVCGAELKESWGVTAQEPLGLENPDMVKAILEWLEKRDAELQSRRSVVEELTETLGVSQRQLWRYASTGLPERMNARVKAAFQLLAIASHS